LQTKTLKIIVENFPENIEPIKKITIFCWGYCMHADVTVKQPLFLRKYKATQ